MLISLRRGFCPYNFRKLWNEKIQNFQYRFVFIGECGGDEGRVSRASYSGKTMNGQLRFQCISFKNFIVGNLVLLESYIEDCKSIFLL